MSDFGPTGDFPRGSIREDDEGGLQFGIAADPMNQTVVLNFGKPVAWIGMSPSDARMIAKALIAKADQLDGGIGA